VLLGKNGAGKSTRLREIDARKVLHTKYISPERGGSLKYSPNVDNNMANNESWLDETRRKNRFEQFREQSAAQFRNLEMLELRKIESDFAIRGNHEYTFSRVIEKINDLLPAIKLVRADKGFIIQSKNGQPIQEDQISSGESELIALSIEVLVFSRSEKHDKILILDEPDVHLHPDLQQKFIKFVESVAEETAMRVVIATHSTAMIGAFSSEADLIVIQISGKEQVTFNPFRRSRICNEVLPIFGVHPLSTVFNLSPVLLVEGEDDKRVIDQAVRSSGGRMSLTPCVVGSVTELGKWEDWLNQILPAIYDNPKGLSLRDLDNSPQSEIDDVGIVVRSRLNCYAIENILLTTECLEKHGFNEESFKEALSKWAAQFPSHKYIDVLKDLIENFHDRRSKNIKDIRNIVVAVFDGNKPWEVIVGQLLAENMDGKSVSDHSINSYLGKKAKSVLFS